MSARNCFLLLLTLCGLGIVFNYSIGDFVYWARTSITFLVFCVFAIVVIFGVVTIFICAKIDEARTNKSRKLYEDSIANYDERE